MRIDDRLHGISTIIETSEGQATGFYFQVLAEKKKEEAEWRAVEELWLVTNRHVVLTKVEGKETFVDSLSFGLRKVEGSMMKWVWITLSTSELEERTKLHTNPQVDIAAVQVLDKLTGAMKAEADAKWVHWEALSEGDLIENNVIKVGCGDEALVAGYPKGFYDSHNLFPIVKAGIIATRWGAHFDDSGSS